MKKTILFICHRIPYPPNKGEKIRSFNILSWLSAHHDVLLAFLIDEPRDEKYVPVLDKYAAHVIYDTISPLRKVWLLPKLFQGESVSVHYFYSAALQRELDALLEWHPVDYVFCSSSQTAEYLFRSSHWEGRLRRAGKVIDMIDMDSYKWIQYAENKSWPQNWVYRREGENLFRHEKKIAASFGTILFVSDLEKALFEGKIAHEHVAAVGNGVDLDFFHPSYRSQLKKEFPVLVFYGAMDYWPNVQAVEWFADHVLPRLLPHYPQLKFYIAGSNPAHEIRALGRRPGIEVTGYVADIRDYIALADVCVMPLQIARGIQNKVLEAMAMGKPVVCSPEAHEGISAEHGVELFIAASSDDFAARVMELLANESLRMEIGGRARSCVERNYAWAEKLSALERIFV